MYPVSFVVITCDRPNKIGRLVKSLGDQVEVVVVDDSDYLIRYPSNVIVDYHKGKRGAVNCLNIGIERASNDYVVCMGDDSLIHDIEGFCIDLIQWIDRYPLIGFDCIDKYNNVNPSSLQRKILWEMCGQVYPPRGNRVIMGRGLFTCFFAFDKSRLKKSLDSNFKGSGFNADVDFMLGEDSIYLPFLKVYHDYEGRGSRRLMLSNRKYFLQKHFSHWRFRYCLYIGYHFLFPLFERVVEGVAPKDLPNSLTRLS